MVFNLPDTVSPQKMKVVLLLSRFATSAAVAATILHELGHMSNIIPASRIRSSSSERFSFLAK